MIHDNVLMIYYQKQICANCFDVLYNISFKEHLPEDGNNRWPKHAAGYAVYNTINLHICIGTCWVYCS